MTIEATHRTVILGRSAATVSGDAPREPGRATWAEIEALLAPGPRVAIVADAGLACFFRASLALERGVARVLVRHDALDPTLLGELAARARELGGELAVRGPGARQALARPGARVDVGAQGWGSAGETTDPTARGAVASDDLELPTTASELGDDDSPSPGVPAEEIAFAIGLKPVLYLVIRPDELVAARTRHPGAHVVTEPDRVSVDVTSGSRAYGEGADVLHAFMAADRRDAQRALDAWRAGSSRHVHELGALMGYPPCCTAAFAALASRRDNAALVHVTATRTRSLSASYAPALNVAVHRWVPFTPCVFSCRSAVAWSERVLGALEPGPGQAATRALARPVYYVDEAHAVVFGDARLRVERGTIELEYANARWLSRRGADPAVRAEMAQRFGTTSRAAFSPESGELRPALALPPGRPGVLLPFGAG